MNPSQDSPLVKGFPFQKIFILVSVLVLGMWGMFLFSLDIHLVNASKVIFLDKSEARVEIPNNIEITEISFDTPSKNLEQTNNDMNSSLEFNEKKVDTGQIIRDETESNLKLIEYKNQKIDAKKAQSELESKLLQFEKKEFQLKGIGKAWEAAPHIGKQAQINLTLYPIKGKGLTEFEITQGKIIIGDSTFNFKNGAVELRDSEIYVNILSKGNSYAFGTMKGSSDSPIIDTNYKIHAKFENQLFYLNSADRSPFHLTFDVILTDR